MKFFQNIIICGGLFLSFVSQILVEQIGYRHYEQNLNSRLFDIGHLFLPDLSYYKHFDNILPFFFSLFIFQNRLFWSRFLIVIFLRAICIPLTILPKTTNHGLLTMGGNYDKIFSGHMCFVYIATKTLNLPYYQHILFTICNTIIILCLRTHYTIDIVLAIIICELLCNCSMGNLFFKKEKK